MNVTRTLSSFNNGVEIREQFLNSTFIAYRNRDACLNARRVDRSLRASIDRRRVIHARDEEIRYPQCSNEPDHARNQEDKNCDLNHSFPGHDFYVLQRGQPRYVTCDAFQPAWGNVSTARFHITRKRPA